ncbi:MAG: hypothetical protein HOP30_17790 [Cyclobacteriaceae bacterium]|nr:hypothetical protein [Cyclobacteriaceae bacterium]
MKINILKPTRYLWVGPLLIFINGIGRLYLPNRPDDLVAVWYGLTVLAFVLIVIGVVNHVKYNRGKKDSNYNE